MSTIEWIFVCAATGVIGGIVGSALTDWKHK